MRFVSRPPQAPPSLSAPAFVRRRAAYLDWLGRDPRARAQTRPPERSLPPSPALLTDLSSLFDHKCAFCERKVTLQVFRFRPPSEALPFQNTNGDLAYGWLADAWQNLLPICADCLPTPRNAFPVAARRAALPSTELYTAYMNEGAGSWPQDDSLKAEEALLLDPSLDQDLDSHLLARPDGHWERLTERGSETIKTYKLNRPALVAARAAAVAAQTGAPDQASEFAGFLRNLAQSERAAPSAPITRRGFERPADSLFSMGTGSGLADLLQPAETEASYTLPPALVKVEIKGFKGIEKLELDLPAPDPPDAAATARLILGENSAGKSSLLEAIALTLAPPEARAALKLDPQALLLDPAQMGSALAARKSGLVRLTFRAVDGTLSRVMLRLTRDGFETKGVLPKGLPIFAYGAYRHYVKACHGWAPERGIITLFRAENLLSNPGTWLESLSDAQFDEVVQALRFIFGPGGGFLRIDRSTSGCMVVTSAERHEPEGAETFTPLDAVSSGFRTMLALTCDVMRWLIDPESPGHFPSLKSARGVLLVDEIESHLHPRWKIQVMAGLRQALPGMTIIATTHDPLCLRGMKDGEVLVLRRIPGIEAGSQLPMKVDALTTLPDIGKLTIEQLLKSDFFALYDTDDPHTGASMAELVDALAGISSEDGTETEKQEALLAQFRAEVNGALPVGSSEVSMLVQEAVADFLREQQTLTAARRSALRAETKKRIVAILKGVRDAPS
ncbi:uncharacterized protein DUF2813 [Rhodobacter aestuarii]|uniref:AAA+ ATPase domain-containing protein n=1 Tax=Rhodobacter aestuarii TaxID=453582 RepID=A0A1N7IUF4_9RHOB|nr:uncharacterized protein DUF2813 [Rhodobacter aestuarii]SIS40670.1 Protein of unknown function [Rhodobacter aestuarii]